MIPLRPVQQPENPIWDPVFSDTLKIGSLYLLYATVTACFVETLSDCIKLEAAAVGAMALTVLGKVGERFGEKNRDKTFKKLCTLEIALIYGLMDLVTRDLLTHELGHALMAKGCYAFAHPTISVTPFIGGETTYFKTGLTSLGKFLGKENVSLWITAAGPLASFATSLSFIAVAHFNEKKHPQISKSLEVAAIVSIGSHIEYALSALRGKHSNGHDFARLARGGYHPIPLAMGMVMIPTALKLSLIYLEENPEN